jgi:Putative transposase
VLRRAPDVKLFLSPLRARRALSVVQTFGDRVNFHPHVHVLASRGGWTASGEWIPVPYVDEGAAERLFRHKVLALLRRRGLLSQERIELLLSWRRSFSIHNRVYVPPGDSQGLGPAGLHLGGSPLPLSWSARDRPARFRKNKVLARPAAATKEEDVAHRI